MQLGGGGGHDQQGENQQRAGDLAGLGGRGAEQYEEDGGQCPYRQTPRRGHGFVDGGEQQGPSDARENGEDHGGDHREQQDLAVADAQEAAEQQRVHAAEEALVEGDEQESAGQQERLHGPGERGLLASALPGAGDQRDDDGRGEAEREVAEADGHPDKYGAGRAGEADDRQGVRGERLSAQHHEPANRRRQYGDHRAGTEGVDHEGVGPHHLDVGERVPRPGHGVSQSHGRPLPAPRGRAGAGRRGPPGVPGRRPRPAVRRRCATPRRGCRTAWSGSRR